MGRSWGGLGRCWAALGRSWVAPGRSWVGPGPLLGRSWPLLGGLRAGLDRSWGGLGRSWEVLGASWGGLGAVLGRLGRSWAAPRRSKTDFKNDPNSTPEKSIKKIALDDHFWPILGSQELRAREIHTFPRAKMKKSRSVSVAFTV